MGDDSKGDFSRKLRNCHNIEDLRRAARRALPFPLFDHVDGGSDDETTLQANTASFHRYCLKPRYCSGVETVDASTTVMGQRIEWPYFAGPAGGLRYLHRDGEIGVARAAEKYGTAYAMSGWTNTAPATLDMLPAALDAVGGQVEIIFDSGIRRGTDILKAIALGATACTGSRLYCYGLAAGGQKGVERALQLLRAEVERNMIFMGTATLDQVNRDCILDNPNR